MKVVDLKNIKFNECKTYEKSAKMQYSLQQKEVTPIDKVKMKKISYKQKQRMAPVKHKTISSKLSYKKRNGDAYTVGEIILIILIVLLVIGIIIAGVTIFLNYSLR
ncbi:hypothetical protein [Clostridium thermobutyricum]|uniref:Uncharacterized protein n=1 Tax=Clostridium thermobutyricum TaxID=29372 RepID=N9Y743_9CLOT|nr:hypothetical protein [Clostridium thermobutyricum]ENZ04039.1 hypothetical protein HMPREF1092_00060 [Clostridium thermobutyricum]